MAWCGQAALARTTPIRRRVPRLADHTGLSIFLRERKGSSPLAFPARMASGGGHRRHELHRARVHGRAQHGNRHERQRDQGEKTVFTTSWPGSRKSMKRSTTSMAAWIGWARIC